MPSPNDAMLEAYRQAFEMVRHYTDLRYTVLTAFVVISGGLFTLALGRHARHVGRPQFLIPGVAGIVVAVAFGCAHWRISDDLDFYRQQASRIGKELALPEEWTDGPRSTPLWESFGKVLTLIIYGGAVFLWLITGYVYWARDHTKHQGDPKPSPNQPLQPTGASVALPRGAPSPAGGPGG